jgi:hypothetical protein
MLIIRKIEAVATGPANRPKLSCTITECGEMWRRAVAAAAAAGGAL